MNALTKDLMSLTEAAEKKRGIGRKIPAEISPYAAGGVAQ